MGKALEILSGGVTAPAAVATTLTLASGDSLTIRNAPSGKIKLLTAWNTQQTTAGELVIRSPRLHDNVRGITFPAPLMLNQPRLWLPHLQSLESQDTLTVTLTGSAVAGDIELASLLVYYENLPGIDANLITPDELKSKGVDILTVQNTITTTTGPNYTGAVAINATNDLMRANTLYALVGYSVSAQCGAITFRGSDTGNLRIGGPGRASEITETRDWFIRLSDLTQIACIPVFNSANKSNTFVEAQQDENAAAVVVTSIFIELQM
jgi:hypothetical protein